MIDFVSFSAGAWAVCGGLPQWVFDTAIRGSQTHHCFILNTTNEKYVGKRNCGGKKIPPFSDSEWNFSNTSSD